MPSKFYNYQYYQSGEFTVVSFIGLRGVPQENILVNIQPTNLTVTINTPDFDPFSKSLDLYLPIDPATSTYQVFPSKVEIKLHKVEQVNWPTLEKASVLPTPSAASTTTASTFSTERWDRFCEENKEEVDTSGEKLFRVLYEGATQEQRRAMIKSLQQSNGKVLNMNWDEVKDKNFEEEAKK
ncbi:protein SGT1-like protein [Blastocystis sp. subtype 4]|uniref:protein SGT1-like protein n=1 Tax=Blastocystis sp. subtype 4 TaxID=944170 RepID=UPI00071159B6|nr:protein SGT1-like protein [Blastocystis sp. subtype 4]KNB44269.1 protein SGT1-like protein [Blastocystis sp. subtype 4]|eukprot:XP_014527712.1 protein SGT1-like protein [Blastocystis sp. subtype 4]